MDCLINQMKLDVDMSKVPAGIYKSKSMALLYNMKILPLILLAIMLSTSCQNANQTTDAHKKWSSLISSERIERYSVNQGDVDSIRLSTYIIKSYDMNGRETQSTYFSNDGSIMMQFINEYQDSLKTKVIWKNAQDSLVRTVRLYYDNNGKINRSESYNKQGELIEGYLHRWKQNGKIEEKAPLEEDEEFRPNAIYYYNDQNEFSKLEEFDENDSLYYIAFWNYNEFNDDSLWTERVMVTRDTIRRVEKRIITYAR